MRLVLHKNTTSTNVRQVKQNQDSRRSKHVAGGRWWRRRGSWWWSRRRSTCRWRTPSSRRPTAAWSHSRSGRPPRSARIFRDLKCSQNCISLPGWRTQQQMAVNRVLLCRMADPTLKQHDNPRQNSLFSWLCLNTFCKIILSPHDVLNPLRDENQKKEEEDSENYNVVL